MSSRHHEQLKKIASLALEDLSLRHEVREKALRLGRNVIRLSANAIRAIHRQEFNEAQQLLDHAKTLLSQTMETLEKFPDIYFAGYLADARKEYSEGNITLALISNRTLPKPSELKVGMTSYLNGLGEAIGELRRYILDSIRRDEIEQCEELLEVMDEAYTILVTMDFPDALTGGLRRTTDMVRGVLERTRGDLTMALRQRQLRDSIAYLTQHLSDT